MSFFTDAGFNSAFNQKDKVTLYVQYQVENDAALHSRSPRMGSWVVRIDPLHFLARCRTRRLNQV